MIALNDKHFHIIGWTNEFDTTPVVIIETVQAHFKILFEGSRC